MSAAVPHTTEDGSWIIIMAPLRMIRSSPAMAMTEALEAAIASTTTVTLPL